MNYKLSKQISFSLQSDQSYGRFEKVNARGGIWQGAFSLTRGVGAFSLTRKGVVMT